MDIGGSPSSPGGPGLSPILRGCKPTKSACRIWDSRRDQFYRATCASKADWQRLAIAKLTPMPTAVMAVNDLTAVGVIKGLLKAGCRVPQDVSVTGFDNTRLAEYSNPSLTTVDVHRDMLGQMAADALHELSRSPNPQGREYQIPAELILGDSSGPAPSEQMP